MRLKEPLSVVLTRTMAKKYFGDESPLGHTLKFQRKYDCKVTGVIEDFPSNSDFPFTTLISYPTLNLMAGDERMNNWFAVNDTHHVFIVLSEKTSQAEMEELIAKVHASHTPEELHKSRHYLLQKLSDLHFDAKFSNFSYRTISKDTIAGLAIVAAFLLLTGSINYINLATAQSILRSKEIGLRKVMGSNRANLILQFLTETFIVVAISGVIAFLTAEILRFNLQSLLNFNLTSYNFADPFTIGMHASNCSRRYTVRRTLPLRHDIPIQSGNGIEEQIRDRQRKRYQSSESSSCAAVYNNAIAGGWNIHRCVANEIFPKRGYGIQPRGSAIGTCTKSEPFYP